jgi:hypothetical protein
MLARFEVLYKGQVPKEFSYRDAIEDCFDVNEKQCKLVLCDGASESFDSQSWARLLCEHYIKTDINIHSSPQALLSAVINEYNAKHVSEKLSWSKQAAFERGSFSTFLGVNLLSKSRLHITAIGDTIAVLTDGNERLKSFPYEKAEGFLKRPNLLSTNQRHNDFFEHRNAYRKTWKLEEKLQQMLICMTDALAEWAFRNEEMGNPVWRDLIKISTYNELMELVKKGRKGELVRMRVDDVSLIVLKIVNEGFR